MSEFKDRLAEAMNIRDISAAELSRISGVNEGAVSQYRAGKYKASQRSLDKLARALNVSIPWLMGADVPMDENIRSAPNLPSNCLPVPRTVKKPRLGAIACGKPILAVENISEYDEVPADIHCDFTLLCKGDSMIDARILDGDVVYIRQQPVVESGEIAAVRIGDEATLKKVYYNGRRIILRACNPLYADMEYEGEELNDVEILGKAVAFSSMI